MELVNAGHVSPYVARGSDVTVIELPVDLPFGLFARHDLSWHRSLAAAR
jgi:hypothetical protein